MQSKLINDIKKKIAEKKIVKKKIVFDEIKLIYMYRYVSLLFTSLLYIFVSQNLPITNRLIGVVLLLISAIIINDIYIKNKSNVKVVGYAVFLELVAISIILIPTGGLKSPFIWYAINPIIVAAILLPTILYWVDLSIYLTLSLVTTYAYLNGNNTTILNLVYINLSLILVMVLVSVEIKMLSNLIKQLHISVKELDKQNKELISVNKIQIEEKMKAKQSFKDIMSLYQIVQAFTNQGNLSKFLKMFLEHCAKLMNSEITFLWMAPFNLNTSQIEINNIEYLNLFFVEDVKKMWENKMTYSKPKLVKIDHKEFFILIVRSQSKKFGLIGISAEIKDKTAIMEDYFQKMIFLSELSAIVLERINFEKVNENLMLYDEAK
jgi:two-component system, NarL family, sensor histidine kinase LiaS